MDKIIKRFICGILTIALVLSLIPNMGEVKSVEASGTASDIVSAANKEVGYAAGANKDNKYGRWYGLNNDDWCAIFISWCANQAGVPQNVIKKNANAEIIGNYVRTGNFGGTYYPRGSINPQPGDIVYYDFNGVKGTEHVEIVTEVSNGTIVSVGGNTQTKNGYPNGLVSARRVSLTYSAIYGYERPNYGGTPQSPTISNLKITDLSDLGYTIECDIENANENDVRFPTWPSSVNNADEIIWYGWDSLAITVNGNHYSFRLPIDDFNLYRGSYNTHIYAGSTALATLNNIELKKYYNKEATLGENNYRLYDCNISWKDAKKYAESLGGHLVTITSEQENNLVKSLIKSGDYDSAAFWIGASDELSEGLFCWVTGESFGYMGEGTFDNAGDVEDYVGIYKDSCNWNDFPDSQWRTSKIGFIVEFEPEVTQVSGTLNGHEYIVYKDSLTATEARMKEADGWHLATITSADENNFIMSLIKKISNQPEGYWFGANDNQYEGHFRWETGEPFVYSQWPDGQPDNKDGSTGGPENYFGIWTSGIWNDFPESYKLGYVLEKDPPVSTTSGTLNDHEYMISSAYMTRTEAEEYQTDGWYLATITSSEEREYIVSLIRCLKEKNLQGYWLGGNDVANEGSFVWETGEEFSYADWGDGQPSNINGLNQNENYLAITNSGKFNDENESYYLGFVLERDSGSKLINVDSINISSERDETMDAYEDDTFQLTAEVLPEEASNKTVTWSCSDTDYAIVDDNGKVTVKSTVPDAVKTIIITATNSDGTVSASYSFVVCPRSSCDHAWDDGKIIKDATCSEYGEKKYTCSKCETTKIETIGLKAHTPVDDDEVLATCDTEGKTKGSHCSVCGKVISEQTTVPALGHQFGNYIPNNDETCIANGTATAICERCGKSDSIIIEDSATGIHIWGEYEVTKPATCTEIGIKTRKCINCNKTSSAGIVKAAHEYVDVVTKEPTCTEKGTVTFTCANCGDTYDEDIEPLGHNEVPDPAKAATSTSTGLTEGSHCSRCNTVLIEQQIIPKLEECTNHVWGEYVVTTEPTCTTVGVKTRCCQVCGKKSTLGIPIVAHNYVEEVQKESTCGEAGILKKTCSMCGDEKYESLEKKAHTIVTDPAVAATANSTGLTEGSHCSVCGTVMKAQEVIPVLSDDSYKENNKPENKKSDGDNTNADSASSNNVNTDSSSNNNTNTDSSNSSQTDGAAGDNSNHYSSEWVDGKWYDANGNQTYEGTLQWKSNSVGWWVEDSAGWYPQNSWQKIDGVWYYFKPDGYMASGEYYNGYWFNGNGSWDPTYQLSWKSNSTGWWVEDVSGWWPSNSWLKIDGYWYYFNSSGYMVTSQYIDGYWIGADGICR